MNEKFELIKDLLMDVREEYAVKVNDIITGSLGNGDITEEEAAELRSSF